MLNLSSQKLGYLLHITAICNNILNVVSLLLKFHLSSGFVSYNLVKHLTANQKDVFHETFYAHRPGNRS